MRKYPRSDSVEPKFTTPGRASGLDPYADKLSHMLRQEAAKSRKQKRTAKQLHADLIATTGAEIDRFAHFVLTAMPAVTRFPPAKREPLV